MTTNMSGLHLFLRFLSLFVIFTSNFTLVIGLSGCGPDHIQALVQFKNEFDSSGCNQTDYFSGVLCDNMKGEVTKLQLPSGCLTGTLKPNSSLFGFHHLRHLNLSHNNFTSSSLPSEFSNLSRLEVLSLSSNSFIGQVPSSFCKLTWLNQLDLSHNQLTGNFQLVQNLTKLSILDLSDNHFSGTIPSSLLRMPFLSSLDLSENHLTGSIEVPNSSSSLRLEKLSLSHNHFEGQILEPISNLITLKLLDLSYLDISYPIDIQIFSPLKSLLILFLSGNSISSTSLGSHSGVPFSLEKLGLSGCNIGEFPIFLKSLQNLNFIDISNNKIIGDVPEWLWKLPRLSTVTLVSNSFTGFEGSPEVIVNSSVKILDLALNHFKGPFPNPPHSLTVLSAWNNSFTGSIPPAICNQSTLALLDLSYNNFTGTIPRCLSNLQNSLLVVNLRKNNLQGSLPDNCYDGALLRTLDVGFNQLTGTLDVEEISRKPHFLVSSVFPRYFVRNFRGTHFPSVFPSESACFLVVFGNLSRLEVLNLQHSELTGTLEPISKLTTLKQLDLSFLNINYPIDLNLFSSLSSLLILDLSGNSISPTTFSSNPDLPLSLEVLDLSGCGISQFPSFLKGLHSLESVYISNNNIKGKVPEWFWSFPRLRIVNLVNNSFTGFEGSGEVLVNSSVKILDLALNHFKGPFPNPPHSLTVLSAWNNSFTGSIPLAICNQTMLALLDLSYNNFTGSIPPCLSNFQTSLIVVNLRKNKLEGSLPDMCYDGALLRTLDVDFNQLSGKLPRSLLNCTSLKFLSVDNNKIKDTFPFWLKDLPYLQALTLRSNRFYGPLSPSGQGLFAFPELRILEVSHNNFTGSLPSNYFVNWKASSLQMIGDGELYMADNSIADYTYQDTIDLQYKGLFMEQGKVLTSYATIDFSGNRLEGQIPESIGLLKTLIALNLSNNAFTGHIPLSLSNVSELESLDLSGNQLTGTIPKGLERLSYLAYISVAHNHLTGEIPQGTQITGQPKSSFEGNEGLCGLPLEESCFGTNAPPMQQQQDQEKEEEEVLNWKAVAMGYGTGLLLGLSIAQVIASYKPEWLVKIAGLYKCRTC